MNNKRSLVFTIALTLTVLLLASCSTTSHRDASKSDPTGKRKIIIDTDMAIDDWAAILFTLQHPDASVLAITITGAGEAYCEEGMRNAQHLISIADQKHQSIIVACGDSEPLDGYNVFPQPWRDDANSLFGIPTNPDLPESSKTHAVQILKQLLENANETIDVLAFGNLTNIAQLVIDHPQSALAINELYMMGGAFNIKGNIIVPGFTDNNLNKVSEWNIYIDPVAAKIVFDSKINKTLVPLDATNTAMVTHEFARKLKSQADSEAAKFQDKVLDRNKGFISSKEYFFWDVMAAVFALSPEICTPESHYVTVVADAASNAGPNTQAEYSATRFDGKPRQILNPENSGQTLITEKGTGRKVKICMRPDAALFERLFIDGLNGQL